MSWFGLDRGGVRLRGRDVGQGPAVVFQHGLGGDEAQVADVFPQAGNLRRLTLECRGQGQSAAGGAADFSIKNFADDVMAFADARGVEKFAVGGISMGAAIALNLAVRQPRRVTALVLARPAWLWDTAPPNMRAYAEIAGYLARPDLAEALADFEASALAGTLAREAPDNLATLKRFFAVPDRKTLAALLAAIAADGPGVSEAEVGAISVPTLVIGHRVDALHPFAFAETLAGKIPGARLLEITPKALDKARYAAEFRAGLTDFLVQTASERGPLH